MKNASLDLARILHIAAWVWLCYLILLACIDLYSYPLHSVRIWFPYYFVNGAIALLFLGCSYWSWLQNTFKVYYIPLMIFIIAALPIIASRLWIPPFPLGPMSNIEGLTLRLLPVLFIGLIVVAWRYTLRMIIFFAMGTAVLEIILVQINPPAEANGPHALLFISLVRSASFLVVGYFVNRLIDQLKAQQSQLAQANTQLIHYASTIEQLSISRERNRLARELHDTLAHTLSGLSVQLETAKAYWDVDPGTARSLLVDSLEATRTGLDDTRYALKALRAGPIEDLGLLLGLEQLAQSAAERGRLALALSLPDQLPSCSPDVEQAIYRIAQEAIENVVHHADAENLWVQLNILDAGINLWVEDDGLGFDLKQDPEMGHYGLKGIRERAQLMGADLKIDSQPNRGTHIQLTIKGI